MNVGDLISQKYRLVRRLGEGGMAEVWSAQNELTQRDFAIKVILPGLAHNREALDRFLQEAKATARLHHPSLVNVFDVGRTRDGRPFLVMELLSGESLEQLLTRKERLCPLDTAELLAPIAGALDVAHRAGIVHRDLSSANVFLAHAPGEAGVTPKVLDFGVSKILEHADQPRKVRTDSGAVLGSPDYMSPEQAQGAECVDARSDVWSLGVLLYECLYGDLPFVARNYNALMLAIVSRPHVPIYERMPRLDPELAELVESCLIKDREARIQSAREVADTLDAIALRLSRPHRRSSDRRSLPGSRPSLAPGLLPPATLPLGVRLWQLARSGAAPRVLAVSGAIGGTAVGLAIGVAITARDPEPIAAAASSARPPEPEPKVTPVESLPEPRGVAQRGPEDLTEAVAQGLGVQPRKRSPRAKPARPGAPDRFALAPRKNPY